MTLFYSKRSMPKFIRFGIFPMIFLMLCVTSYTQAQHHDHSSDANGVNHVLACRTGVNFVDNLPPAALMDGVGHSSLKINTTSPLAQQYFSQGVSLLHCFWDFEAYRSFKEAIHEDSSAIMPYWGLLHTILFIDNKEFDADKEMAINKMNDLVDRASGYEALYAKGILDQAKTGKVEGYMKNLEYIVHQYPDDTDAKLFLALFNMSGYDADKNPRKGNLYSEYLLRDLLRTNPENAGVHHYWIHQMEDCCPEEALESANILASLAPKSGHIVHMPGHIYYKMGDYKNAHDQFIAAMKVDSAYMAEQHISELDNWNYIHNLNYLLANCAQDGRYKEGLYYAHKLENMVPNKDRIDMHRSAFFYQGKIVPAIMEMRFGSWDNAIQKFNMIDNSDTLYGMSEMDYKEALTLFSSGMASLENKDIPSAIAYSDKLDALFWRNSQYEKEEDRLKGRNLRTLNVASVELRGNILIAQNDYNKGIETLEKAVKMEKDLGYSEPPYYPRPTLISLATAYLNHSHYEKAAECYNKIMQKHPNSAMAYWGLMNVYKAEKEKTKYAEAKTNFDLVTQYGNRSVFR